MMINKHLQNQLDSSYCSLLPDDIKKDLESEYLTMSSVGVENNEDQNKFLLILNHIPEIAKSIFDIIINNKMALAVAAEVFKNKEKMPIDTLLGLIEAIDLALNKMLPSEIKPKIAYPQPNSMLELPKYDMTRWVSATHKIYSIVAKGHSEQEAKEIVLGSWDKREKMDYNQWLKFYKEKTPEKYPKLASFDSELTLAGVPANSLKAVLPAPSGFGYNKSYPGVPQNLPHSTNDVSDVRDKIETQRRKIISRLNSAEKMLSSIDGQMFAGPDQEFMLKLLQDLKRRIQTANKRTVNSSLFEDHIIRTANQLRFEGKRQAAGFFYKIAQLPPLGAPAGGLGGPGGLLDGSSGGVPGEASETLSKGDKKETEEILREFFDNLKRGVNDKDDTPEEREALEKAEESVEVPAPEVPAPEAPQASEVGEGDVSIEALPDEPVFEDGKEAADVWDMVMKIAQVPSPPTQAPSPSAPPQPQQFQEQSSNVTGNNTEDVIDAALNNITVQDVIKKLETLVTIYNQRDISRQLAVLDIMMDRLGLASFFPALGEAMGKALEANQYIGNRLEEVLGKLKGSLDMPQTTQWIETPRQENPATAGIRSKLEHDQNQEDQRKDMRKQKELAKMQGSGGPNVSPAADGKVPEAEMKEPVSRVEKQPKIETR